MEFKDCFDFEPKFYILCKKDDRVVAVEKESDTGYNGVIISYSFEKSRVPQWQFEISPYFIAKTYLSQLLKEYDFTIDIKTAENYCMN